MPLKNGPGRLTGVNLDVGALLQLVDFSLARKTLLFNSFLTVQPDKSKARILQTFDLPMTPAAIRAPRLTTGSNPRGTKSPQHNF